MQGLINKAVDIFFHEEIDFQGSKLIMQCHGPASAAATLAINVSLAPPTAKIRVSLYYLKELYYYIAMLVVGILESHVSLSSLTTPQPSPVTSMKDPSIHPSRVLSLCLIYNSMDRTVTIMTLYEPQNIVLQYKGT